jgi:hypothetical protein
MVRCFTLAAQGCRVTLANINKKKGRCAMRKPTPEYVNIKTLAERMGVSQLKAIEIANSPRLQRVPGAVLDVNTKKNAKYRLLRVNVHEAIRIYGL